MFSSIFNNKGVPKIDPGPIVIANARDLTVSAGKINITNDSDNLLYTLACQNINGQPVLYLFQGGNARLISGVNYLRSDTDSLWYALKVQNINGQSVIYLATPGVTLP